MPELSTRLQRLMRVQPGETGKVTYFLAFFLLVSAGTAIGNSTANALFLKRLGIEYLPLLYMGQSVVLAAVSLVYAAIADRVPAECFFRLMFSVLLMLVSGCWLLVTFSGSGLVYPAYYLVYEVASEVLLVHAALYLNQNMNTLQVKRLAPLMFAGAQVGNISGGLLLALLAPVTGAGNLLLLWCLLLTIALLVLYLWHHRHGRSLHFRAPHKSRHPIGDSVEQVRQGIRFTLDSALLRAASLATFFMVIGFYIMNYSINRIYNETFTGEAELTGFLGSVTAATGTIALLLQLFVTSRMIERFGVRRINMLFPVSTTLVLAALTFSFTLPFALLGSLNRDAIMTAFRNPVRAMFFNVLPAYMQGRARALMVAIVLPLALFVCGLLLWIMQRTQDPVIFVAPGVLAAGLYVWFNLRMNRAYVGTLVSSLRERLYLPDDSMYRDLGSGDEKVLADISRGVQHVDPVVAVSFARALVAAFPDQAAGMVIERAARADAATADRLLGLLAGTDLAAQATPLQALAARGDAHLQSTVMRLLARTDGAGQRWQDHLHSDNPRLSATAIHLALQNVPGTTIPEGVVVAWQQMLDGDKSAQLAALALIADLNRLPPVEQARLVAAYGPVLLQLLDDGPDNVRIHALQGLATWPCADAPATGEQLAGFLQSDNPGLREAAGRCLHLLGEQERAPLQQQALADGHARVRAAAIDSLETTGADFTAIVPDWILASRVSLRAQAALLDAPQSGALPMDVFEAIALAKAREAERLQQALHVLRKDAPDVRPRPWRLLEHVLEERIEQTVQLALQALRTLYEPGLIEVIRAGFASGDERFVANASEALSTIDDREAPALLHRLLLNRVEETVRQDTGQFRSVREVLDWCAGFGETWLQTCVNRLERDATLAPAHDRPD